MVITPMFWILLAPKIFPLLKPWTMEWYMMGVHHIYPILSSSAYIILTDMYFLKKDCKKVFIAAIIYMGCNGLGSYIVGHAMYPIPWFNWETIPKGIAAYTGGAVVVTALHYGMAVWTQKKFKK